ncbi:MAG TPA: glutaredoxin family protein [Nonomuraea sp.]|nr:glutaredoxin family protein [Nonomuraea sp.]
MTSLPDLIVYTKPGCGLCSEALALLDGILAGRRALALPVPAVVERDITSDPAWERAFFDRIPVVDLADRRLEVAVSPARLRRLLVDVLDSGGDLPPVDAALLGG